MTYSLTFTDGGSSRHSFKSIADDKIYVYQAVIEFGSQGTGLGL